MIRTKTMHVTRLLTACLILLCGDLTLAHSQTAQSTAEVPAATPADAVPTAALPVDTTDRPAAQPGPADAHVSRLEDSAPPAASPAPSGDNDAYKLETGDRLKISIYGREDLTAEYRVNDQGQIRIPTLGAFDAAKRMPSELEEAIRQGLERILQRPGNVAVDVIERQPIFVTGLVAKPGAYRFTSGMAVIHATVLAGGTASNGDSLPTEALRERSKIRGARADMKHLIARRARLLTERDGKDEIAMPPELVKLAGNGAAEEVINVEKEALKRQREVRDRQRTALEASIKENKVELEAYEKELANIGEQTPPAGDARPIEVPVRQGVDDATASHRQRDHAHLRGSRRPVRDRQHLAQPAERGARRARPCDVIAREKRGDRQGAAGHRAAAREAAGDHQRS